MNICEMIALADENGKNYVSEYGSYSKDSGFKFNYKGLDENFVNDKLFNEIVHNNCWQLKKEKKNMTKEEIEKALGYEIEIVGNEPKNEKEELNNLEQQLYEQLVNILFGIKRK